MFGGAVRNEPGIDGNAVSSHAGPGVEYVDSRVSVGQLDDFPGVDALGFGNHGNFVGEGDVDVAEGVLGQLDQLGGLGGGAQHLSAHKAFVEGGGCLGGGFVDATHHAVVFHQLDEDAAGQHPLGAVGYENVLADVVPRLLQAPCHHFIGGAHGAGGLQDDQVTGLQMGRNGSGCLLDVAQVGLFAVMEGGRHGNDEDIGWLGLKPGLELATLHGRFDQNVQVGLDDVDAPFVDGRHHIFADIDAKDIKPLGGQQ